MSDLLDNYNSVYETIVEACKRVGRDPSEVKLLPVSKTKPESDILELYNSGIKAFGENYVQELLTKVDNLPKDIEWHMIGHLQRNKVKSIVDKVAMIHSVDSIRLAAEIDKQCTNLGTTVDVLIEMNCEEEQKFGFSFDEIMDYIDELAQFKHIFIKGLMTSAPYVTDSEDNRKFFRKMKQLSVDIAAKNYDNISMSILSMGMTNDYIVAVEEGATHVRVGTAIFGNRYYNQTNN